MRRSLIFFAIFVALATPAKAQIGKSVIIRAGSPEDKALSEISATTDPAQKLALMDKFLAEYGTGDMTVVAYELYVAYYMAAKNYDKVFEYGEKIFSVDPDNFNAGVSLVRAAQERGDTTKLFEYGERAGAILARYKARPAPTGIDATSWQQEKATALSNAGENTKYVEYTLFNVAYQTRDPATRAALLDRFLSAFPDSPYAANAQALVAAAYQQAQNYTKMLQFAQKILARDPNNLGMLLLLSDYFSERGEQLDKAEEYSKKALDLLAAAPKPEGLSDEQWQKEVSLQKGLAWSALGEVHINKNRLAQAVEAFKTASPLLKADDASYGRNLYRLGFTLAKMNRIAEARTVLTEAVSVNSPYRALAQETLNKVGGPIHRPAKKRP